MTALDDILDGLEAELALERELGVRLVECDRGLLAGAGGPPGGRPLPTTGGALGDRALPVASTSETASAAVRPPTSNLQPYDFVFLHDKPFSPAGGAMMAKIITAMGASVEQVPIVFEKPVPKAKVYVILGALALRKFQPTLKGAPGMWLETPKGAPVLVTYSPEYILRFKEITSAVKKIKWDMLMSLKSVLQRCRS